MSEPKRLLDPLVAVDVALFGMDADHGLQVLLVQRSREPQRLRWALPGGVLKPDLDPCLEAAAQRVLSDKVGVEVAHLEQVRTFSGATRDPRGWSIATLFYALLPRSQVHAAVRHKVEAVEWVDAADPARVLAFDHAAHLARALALLRDKVERHTLPLHLMPERFTLGDLQRSCEAILGRPLDKSVFRRRLKGSVDLVETDDFERGASRPARLYRAADGFVFG